MSQQIQYLSSMLAIGDADGVDRFHENYFDWMYAQARRMTRRDESFCLDVVQDAFLRVMRTVKQIDNENRFRGWLRLIVQTAAFDLLRSERRIKNRQAMTGQICEEVDADSLQLDWLQDQMTQIDPDLVRLLESRFEQEKPPQKQVDFCIRQALKHPNLSAEDVELPVLEQELIGLEDEAGRYDDGL